MSAQLKASLPEQAPLKLAPGAGTDSLLTGALESWRQRLIAGGLTCREVAFAGPEPRWSLEFTLPLLKDHWSALRLRVSPSNPVALARTDATAAADMLVATTVQLPDGRPGVVCAAIAPPHNERAIQLLLLSLGWLQLGLLATSFEHNQRAARLLEKLGYVVSQRDARAAAQEWINRTAAWARSEVDVAQGLSLTLFEVRDHTPHWWVASDTAWAERAAVALQQAAEVATRATVEAQEHQRAGWWAVPVMDDGEPVAVLVARLDGDIPPPVLSVLRASMAVSEPLLRHWRVAERSLPRHALHATRVLWRRFARSGHLTWKAAAAAIALVLGVLLLWPVTDRVTADVVIEGRVRHVVTAPFEGFVAQALARPGERVTRGQVLARLDDRDLQLEQSKHVGEREQATGKVRQAMADRDAAALTQASAELQEAEAQVALVEAKLARSVILAPMDGLVVTGDWTQQIGGPVEAGKEMFEIAATDAYRVVLHVPDRDIARVHNGQLGLLRLTGEPGESRRFKVTNVTATATVEEGANGFRVEAAWVGPVPALSPGMQGVGKIEVGDTNLFTVWTRSSIDWLRLKIWGLWV
ncbi:MAG: efflux RND transporter periplasmic adaptor subunit [Vitreoscilla sp.]